VCVCVCARTRACVGGCVCLAAVSGSGPRAERAASFLALQLSVHVSVCTHVCVCVRVCVCVASAPGFEP